MNWCTKINLKGLSSLKGVKGRVNVDLHVLGSMTSNVASYLLDKEVIVNE